MSDIAPNPIGRSAAAEYARPIVINGKSAGEAAPPRRGADRAEFSQTAQLLSRLHDLPDIRFDLVSRVKAEIQSGRYETPERLDKAVENLIDELT